MREPKLPEAIENCIKKHLGDMPYGMSGLMRQAIHDALDERDATIERLEKLVECSTYIRSGEPGEDEPMVHGSGPAIRALEARLVAFEEFRKGVSVVYTTLTQANFNLSIYTANLRDRLEDCLTKLDNPPAEPELTGPAWQEMPDENGNTIWSCPSPYTDHVFEWRLFQEIRDNRIVWVDNSDSELVGDGQGDFWETLEEAKASIEAAHWRIVEEQ